MTKITDTELLAAVWENQLRLTAKGTVERYVGDRYGVCEDGDIRFSFACSEHVLSRHNVTKKIGKQQLLKRLRALHKSGSIFTSYGDSLLTFCIDNDEARRAFKDARQFWFDNGLESGYSNGAAKCKPVPNLETLKEKCHEMLREKYLARE